jgi:cytidylate kinase
MVKQQQAYAKERGVVMDGRDIGTVVFPDAELKIFLVASAEIRAQRRYDELIAKGEKVSFDEIQENVKQRDFLDQTRKESPLRKAEDAIELDNGNLTLEEQRDWLLKRFKEVVE